jgi:DNA-binding phage protein
MSTTSLSLPHHGSRRPDPTCSIHRDKQSRQTQTGFDIKTNNSRPSALDSLHTEHEVATDVTQIREVLQFFNDIASENSLQHTAAAKKVTQALDTLDKVPSDADMTDILLCDRLAYGQQAAVVAYLENCFNKVVALGSSHSHTS